VSQDRDCTPYVKKPESFLHIRLVEQLPSSLVSRVNHSAARRLDSALLQLRLEASCFLLQSFNQSVSRSVSFTRLRIQLYGQEIQLERMLLAVPMGECSQETRLERVACGSDRRVQPEKVMDASSIQTVGSVIQLEGLARNSR
jgi:hypothetical protein